MTTGNPSMVVPPARAAGLLYLITAVAGSLTFFIGPTIVSGDPAATAANIAADEQMWRLNFVMILIAGAAYFGVACSAMTVMHAHQLAPLFYLGDAEYLAAFNAEQLQALSYMPLRLQTVGENMGFFYSGLYTFSLGCLVLGSTFMPRIIGVLLMITGLSWLSQAFVSFLALPLADSLSNFLMAGSIVGETASLLWILVMGVNAEKWRAQAGASGVLHDRQVEDDATSPRP